MATEPLIILVDEKGARVVKKRIEAIGKGATTANTGVQLLKRTLLTLGAGLILRSVIRTIADFEQALSTVKAVSGATEEQFGRLTDKARELGATTRFTATQAAEGLVFLARAGFTVEEQFESIGQTLLLAQAGALDLASAANITVATLRGFRLEANQAARATDVLARASNAANTTIFQLGDSIKFVAPVAAGLGVELEEATAALTALANAGLQASLAGTGLRRVLAELETPGSTTSRILKDLGVDERDVKISTVGLTSALTTLAAAGIDTGQALEAFGQRGGPAFEVLRSSIPFVVEMNEKLLLASGTAERIAEIMDDNLNGALLKVKSAFEAVVLAFGRTTTSGIQKFLLGLANTLRFLAENVEILNGLLIGTAVAVLPKLIAVLRSLTVAIAGTGIGAIAVILGTLIGLIVAFRGKIKLATGGLATIGDLATVVFGKMRKSIMIVVDFFKNNFGFIGTLAKKIFGEFEFSLKGVALFAARAIDLMTAQFRILFRVVAFLTGKFVDLFRVPLNATLVVVGAAISGIIDGFKTMVQRIKVVLNVLIAAANQIPGVAIPAITALFESAGIEIPEIAKVAIKGLADIGGEVIKIVKEEIAATPLRDSVEQVFNEAEALAVMKAADLAKATAAAAKSALPAAVVLDEPVSDIVKLAPLRSDFEQQLKLLRLGNAERELQNALLKIQSKLELDLFERNKASIIQQLKQIRVAGQVSAAVEDVRGEEIDLIAVQEELNLRLKAGSITAEEFERALKNLELQAMETDRTFGAGLNRGLAQIKDQVTDVAGATEDLLVNAFSAAEDALVSFVTTGKVDFKEFVDSVLEDLTRLLLRQALTSLFAGGAGGPIGGLLGLGILGGAGAAAGGAFGGGGGGLFGGLEHGGPVQAGRPVLVGEGGPEIFNPTMNGRVIPGAGMEPPQVNLSVINVLDPNDVVSALNTPNGEKAIVNVISRNKRSLQRVLG